MLVEMVLSAVLHRMRSLETAAQAGVVIVVALAGIIINEAALAGFPAIQNGELPLWCIKVPSFCQNG